MPRLAEIEKDLILRRRRAEEEQWLGEIEGIDMTLTFVRTKQADASRVTHRAPVALGTPSTRQPEWILRLGDPDEPRADTQCLRVMARSGCHQRRCPP